GRYMSKLTKEPLPNELLKYERERHNLSQQEVVDALKGQPTLPWEKRRRTDEVEDTEDNVKVKVSVRTVRRWEQGEYMPSPYYQRRLAKLFKRTALELGYPPEGTCPQIPFWYVPYEQPSQYG